MAQAIPRPNIITDRSFKLVSDNVPKGDQPEAIAQFVQGLNDGVKDQVLLGITGSGKTFTIANVIQETQLPTLVLAHNKTLAAQLYQEFKTFFPGQRGRIFCLVLRLLPARGVRSGVGPLHRKRSDDQRRDRPSAAVRDAGSVRASRRDRGRVGLVYLRSRRSGRVLRDARFYRAGHEDQARRISPAAGRTAIRTRQYRLRSRRVSGPRRRRRDLSELSGSGLPDRVLGR